MPDSRPNASSVDRTGLVLALCHEIGNLVGAVRLQAHLLDGDMSPRELARATLDMEDLCARSGVLLAHVRPLLAPAPAAEPVDPAELVESVCRMMARHAPPGVRLVGEAEADLPPVQADRSVLHLVLQSLVFGAFEAVEQGGTVRVRAVRGPAGATFVIEDDGAPDPAPDPAAGALPRGRGLVREVADAIARGHGGRCRAERAGGHTRVSLAWPARPSSS